jgi:hypothetical protein
MTITRCSTWIPCILTSICTRCSTWTVHFLMIHFTRNYLILDDPFVLQMFHFLYLSDDSFHHLEPCNFLMIHCTTFWSSWDPFGTRCSTGTLNFLTFHLRYPDVLYLNLLDDLFAPLTQMIHLYHLESCTSDEIHLVPDVPLELCTSWMTLLTYLCNFLLDHFWYLDVPLWTTSDLDDPFVPHLIWHFLSDDHCTRCPISELHFLIHFYHFLILMILFVHFLISVPSWWWPICTRCSTDVLPDDPLAPLRSACSTWSLHSTGSIWYQMFHLTCTLDDHTHWKSCTSWMICFHQMFHGTLQSMTYFTTWTALWWPFVPLISVLSWWSIW